MDAAFNIVDIAFKRHADELRATWQGRVLRAGLIFDRGFARPRDKLGMCLLSIVAHSYSDPREDALRVLLATLNSEFQAIAAPFLCTAAKIAKTGHVMADYIAPDGRHMKNQALFPSTRAMEREFRRFADALPGGLDDAERVEMFAAVRRWVVCDYRLDPTMNPTDPDAKRLTVN